MTWDIADTFDCRIIHNEVYIWLTCVRWHAWRRNDCKLIFVHLVETIRSHFSLHSTSSTILRFLNSILIMTAQYSYIFNNIRILVWYTRNVAISIWYDRIWFTYITWIRIYQRLVNLYHFCWPTIYSILLLLLSKQMIDDTAS